MLRVIHKVCHAGLLAAPEIQLHRVLQPGAQLFQAAQGVQRRHGGALVVAAAAAYNIPVFHPRLKGRRSPSLPRGHHIQVAEDAQAFRPFAGPQGHPAAARKVSGRKTVLPAQRKALGQRLGTGGAKGRGPAAGRFRHAGDAHQAHHVPHHFLPVLQRPGARCLAAHRGAHASSSARTQAAWCPGASSRSAGVSLRQRSVA